MRKIYPILLLLLCGIVLGGLYYATKPLPQPVEDTNQTVASTTLESGVEAITTQKEEVTQKPAAKDPHAQESRLRAYTTAYTYYDNTPPGSAIIAFRKADGFATVHDVAGGTGTYADPITVAVGHVIENGVDTPDFAPGTRFYLPNLRKYFMVEDTCGDGTTPQNGPCHKLDAEALATGATVWLDLWIGGDQATKEQAQACAAEVTEAYLVIQNPVSTYAVVPGPIVSGASCAKQFGDKVIEQ